MDKCSRLKQSSAVPLFKFKRNETGQTESHTQMEPFAKSDALIAHWQSLPKQGLRPSLQSFLDRPEPDIQPGIAIADVDSTGKLSVRLYGTGRVKTFNQNFTDSDDPLSAYPGEIGELALEIIRKTVEFPCGFRATVQFASSKPQRILNTVSSLLPLEHETTGVLSVLSHHYLIDDVEPGEFPETVLNITNGEYIDIGASIPA